jgi:membrane protein required for colicin V production
MSSIPWLDVVLIAIMLVSGLLAMIRGFMREVLSIGAWVVAAGATLYAYSKLLPWARTQFSNDIVAAAVVIGGTFLLTLLVVSVITVRFSDMVLDSRVGALDRTLGFLFGLGRGLLIVAVAYMFFDWLVPARTQPVWISQSRSQFVLKSTGEWLISMSPDVEAWYSKYKQKRGIDNDPGEPPPEQRGSLESPGREAAGYGQSERAGMQKLIETTARR